MPESEINCPECGMPIPYTPSRAVKVVTCPGCRNDLEIQWEPEAADENVGAGVRSFERPRLAEGSGARNLTMRQRTKLETGGLGDLFFDPMSGQLAAMNGLGPVGCLVTAGLILFLFVASPWLLLFRYKSAALDTGFFELVSLVPLSGHAGYVVLMLLLPFPLFFLFIVFSLTGSARGGVVEILLTSALILVPFTLVSTAFSLIALLPEKFTSNLLQTLGEFLFSRSWTPTGFRLWMITILALSVVAMLYVHPLLLIYASLTQVIGTTPRTAFIVTPVVPVLHYVLLFIFFNTIAKRPLFDMSEFISIMKS